jgi:hypothetical protein
MRFASVFTSFQAGAPDFSGEGLGWLYFFVLSTLGGVYGK